MKKSYRLSIGVGAPLDTPEGYAHTGTSYFVSRNLEFTDLYLEDINNTTELYGKKIDIELEEDEAVYTKTQYVYNNDPNITSTMSRISALRGDQTGIHISDAIVNTPKLDVRVDYSNNGNGELVAEATDFKMYTSHGEHKSSTWTFKDLDGNLLFQSVKDEDALTSIILPASITPDTNFVGEVVYHADTLVDSNPGTFYNVKATPNSSLFSVEQIGRLVIGRDQYFKVTIRTVEFKSLTIKVKDNLGMVVKELNGLTTMSPKVNTDDLMVGSFYTFEFYIDLGGVLSEPVSISAVSSGLPFIYDYNKEYLDKYDYKHLFFTNGKTSQLSYQLYNDAILLTENISKDINLFKNSNDTLTKINKVIELPTDEPIAIPSLFVQQLYDGSVVISFASGDNDDYGKRYILRYDFNPVTNRLTLIEEDTIVLDRADIVKPGSITTTWSNIVWYVDYTNPIPDLVSYDYEAKETERFPMPFEANSNVSIVRDRNDDIVILSGSSKDYDTQADTTATRNQNNVYIFNTSSYEFRTIGYEIMKDLDPELVSFHAVCRHDGLIMLFNNLDTDNIELVADQSTYIVDIEAERVVKLENDHEDDLPYLGTVVLKNGDILRFTSLGKDPQKIYGYIADSMLDGQIDDNNNVYRGSNELIVKKDEVVTVETIKPYDIVRVEDNGILYINTGRSTVKLTSTWLIVSKDTVISKSEFDAGNYEGVYSDGVQFLIEDTDEFGV